MLARLTLNEARFRRELVTDDAEFGWTQFNAADLMNLDSILSSLTPVISRHVSHDNERLAGMRAVHPGNTVAPSQSIDLCLIAEVEGGAIGCMFTYDLHGQHSLSLATSFEESFSTERDGIDGLVDIADQVVDMVNGAIIDFNGFVAGVMTKAVMKPAV